MEEYFHITELVIFMPVSASYSSCSLHSTQLIVLFKGYIYFFTCHVSIIPPPLFQLPSVNVSVIILSEIIPPFLNPSQVAHPTLPLFLFPLFYHPSLGYLSLCYHLFVIPLSLIPLSIYPPSIYPSLYIYFPLSTITLSIYFSIYCFSNPYSLLLVSLS